jgi:hypothetical protein
MRALITGASSGIGRALAIELAKDNYDLILIARRLERLKEIQSSFANNDILIKQVDLSDQSQVTTLMQEIKDYPIDLFVNNAGFGIVNLSSEIEDSLEENMIDLNVITLHRLTKFAIKHMTSGKIVNISSMASYLPTPLLASYAATKYYVRAYSEALNYEMKIQNRDIHVLTVVPGPIATEFGEVSGMKLKGMPVDRCVNSILKGMRKNKAVIVPGFTMKILRFLLRFVPRKWLLSISYRIQKKK